MPPRLMCFLSRPWEERHRPGIALGKGCQSPGWASELRRNVAHCGWWPRSTVGTGPCRAADCVKGRRNRPILRLNPDGNQAVQGSDERRR